MPKKRGQGDTKQALRGVLMKKELLIFILAGIGILSGCGRDISQVPYHSENSLLEEIVQPSKKAANTKPPEENVLMVNENIEIYDEITVKELLSSSNIELKNGSEIIDTSKIGKHNTKVSYIYNNELYEHLVDYNVVDSTPPVVLNSGEYSLVELGTDFDLNDYVGVADNYDSKLTLTYEGTVDTSSYGTYPIKALASDSSGNETSWELTIEVVDELPAYEDDNTRISFDEFKQQFPQDNVSFGIDVSKWQGYIDFNAVKNAGCSFVIMRIGTYYDDNEMDEYYEANMAAAKEAGLDVGIYTYTTANTKEKIIENAKWIGEQLNSQKLDLPIAFDWEDFANFQQYEMSIHDLNEYFEVFADEMEKLGYSSMLYSSKNFLNNFWYEQKERPVWLAHYTDKTDYIGEYALWQTSCFGRIDGIDGDVDFDVMFNDKIKT